MSVLIGGGTGYVGTELVKALKKIGLRSVVVTRKTGLPNSITWNDLKKEGLPKHTRYVVNLAGASIGDFTKNWEKGYKEEVFESRIETTKSLARAIVQSPVGVNAFIQTSAVGYYPTSDVEEFNEYSEIKGEANIFCKLCKEWEEAGQFSNLIDVRRIVLRFGIVLGRNSPFIKPIYWPFFLGLGGPTGSGKQWLSWIHIDDLVSLIIYTLKNEKISGILNATAPNPVRNKQFAQAFAKAMKRPSCFPLPAFVIKRLFDRDRAEFLVLNGQKVLPKRTLELGFSFKHADVESACKDFLQ